MSASIVSAIISRSNTWSALGDEFELGKQRQLIPLASNDSETIEAVNKASTSETFFDVKDLDL
jgi:hypothetical protein